MGKYWKRRYYHNQKELRKQKRRVKILLAVTISILIFFGSLLLIGYAGKQIQETGKQIQDTATDTADSIYVLIFGWFSANIGLIIGILVFGFIALAWISAIWPRSPPPSYSGY